MKKTCIIIVLIAFSLVSFSQEEATFQTIGNGHKGSPKARISGFAGPTMCFTKIDDQFVHMMGGGGGVIIGNFFLGGYGMGKTTELAYSGEASYNMKFAHGGLWMGYTFWFNKAIHPVFHVQSGWGLIKKTPKDWESDTEIVEADRVFVVVPTLELEMNFSHFFKLGTGINYSLVYNTGQTNSPYAFNDFANPGVFVSLKFGWFK